MSLFSYALLESDTEKNSKRLKVNLLKLVFVSNSFVINSPVCLDKLSKTYSLSANRLYLYIFNLMQDLLYYFLFLIHFN